MESSVRGGQLLQPFLPPDSNHGSPAPSLQGRFDQTSADFADPPHRPPVISLWDSLTFRWVNGLMALGARRQLEPGDLFPLEKSLEPRVCCQLLWSAWGDERREKGERASLLWALVRTYGWQLFALGFLKVSAL